MDQSKTAAELLHTIQQHAEDRMQKSLEMFQQTLAKLRTGRAHPSLLESITVLYYGAATPLHQVASIMIEDARTLSVTAWDKAAIQPIDKAIRSSDLGLNPAINGNVIRVPLPPLTEERRKELVRHLGKEAEEARVSLRAIRREANTAIKQLSKARSMREDEERFGEAVIQKSTDRFVAELDKMLLAKETELMRV